jgi:hypothetical protein
MVGRVMSKGRNVPAIDGQANANSVRDVQGEAGQFAGGIAGTFKCGRAHL